MAFSVDKGAGMRYNAGMTTPVGTLIGTTAKYSAGLVLTVYIIATPPLLIALLLIFSFWAAHRAVSLLRSPYHVDQWLYEQYPDIDGADRRWLIRQERIFRGYDNP